MPLPAIIQFISPGRIACSAPVESRCIHLACEKICDGGEAYVWMREHVGFGRQALWQIDRSHMIEENERPHQAPLCVWQNAPDFEAADVAPPLINYQFDHCFISKSPGRATCLRKRAHFQRQPILSAPMPLHSEMVVWLRIHQLEGSTRKSSANLNL